MPLTLRLPSFSKLRRPRLPFRVAFRIPFRLPFPVLTAAEKTALVALTLVLTSGGALRLWERSGVRLGPVDDWESLRALVIGSREHAKQAGQGAGYPCLDEDPGSSSHGTGGGGGAPGMTTLLAAGAGVASGEKAAPGGGTKAKGGAGKKTPARAVDLNTAGERALARLPGVGPSTARAIVAHRAAHGPFRAVDDLLKVKGIGPKKLEALRPHARVGARAGTMAGLPEKKSLADSSRPAPADPPGP